jgi:ketosteroid isomerase-like protein
MKTGYEHGIGKAVSAQYWANMIWCWRDSSPEDDMTTMMRTGVLLTVLMLCTSPPGAQPTDDPSSSYIRQAESDWAESVVTNDVNVLERILADDFVGVDIDGSHYSKADVIKDYRTKPSEFASNHVNEVQIRFYGDAAVAQGSESWKKKDGTPGTFFWTDTWIKRNGKWQVVAAEDLVAPEAKRSK